MLRAAWVAGVRWANVPPGTPNDTIMRARSAATFRDVKTDWTAEPIRAPSTFTIDRTRMVAQATAGMVHAPVRPGSRPSRPNSSCRGTWPGRRWRLESRSGGTASRRRTLPRRRTRSAGRRTHRRCAAASRDLSSATASAPQRLTSPKPTHSPRITAGSPTSRARVCGLRKMPLPMVIPTITARPPQKPMTRARAWSGGGWVDCSLLPAYLKSRIELDRSLKVFLSQFVHPEALQSEAYHPMVKRVSGGQLVRLFFMSNCFFGSTQRRGGRLRVDYWPE